MRKRLTIKDANKTGLERAGPGKVALAKFNLAEKARVKRKATAEARAVAKKEAAAERAIARHAKTNTAALRRIKQARKKPSVIMAKMLVAMLSSEALNKEVKAEASAVLLTYAKLGIDE